MEQMTTYNNATLFLLIPLGVMKKGEKLREGDNRITKFGFVEAYIKDANRVIEYEYPVFLLFKQKDFLISFQEFLEEEYEKGNLVEDYDYPGGYVVLVYSMPEKYRDDYDKIMRGEFSRTSKDFQLLFSQEVMWKGKLEKSYYYMLFNKDAELKEYLEGFIGQPLPPGIEYKSSPDMERETLYIEKFIENDTDENKRAEGEVSQSHDQV